MASKPKAKKPTVAADFYVGFNGSNPQTNVDEPKLGDQVEYTVLGQVRKVAESIRDDNETRLNIGIEVIAAWPKGTKRPENANQALMFDSDGGTTAEARGETEVEASADEGDEIAARRAETGEWGEGYPEPAGAPDGVEDGT